jgi:hypothetical protein
MGSQVAAPLTWRAALRQRPLLPASRAALPLPLLLLLLPLLLLLLLLPAARRAAAPPAVTDQAGPPPPLPF